MGFSEMLAPVGSPRLKSHRAFVREWTAQTADLVAWLREVAPDKSAQDTATSQVVAVAMDESPILRSSISSDEFDNVEAQLASVKAKLEQLRLNWLQGSEDVKEPEHQEPLAEHQDVAPQLPTSLDVELALTPPIPPQSRHAGHADAFSRMARRGDSLDDVRIRTADGQVHPPSQASQASVNEGRFPQHTQRSPASTPPHSSSLPTLLAHPSVMIRPPSNSSPKAGPPRSCKGPPEGLQRSLTAELGFFNATSPVRSSFSAPAPPPKTRRAHHPGDAPTPTRAPRRSHGILTPIIYGPGAS